MHHSRRSPITSQASVLGLLVLVAALLSLAMPGRAEAAGAPKVTTVEPAQGPTTGGTLVTIKGTGFVTGAAVTIGTAASEVFVVSETVITAKTSATAAGGDEVKVTDLGSSSTLGPTFTYIAPPTVETKAPSSITLSTATLNAIVNPNGGEVTKCEFEYGPTNSYGKTAPCTPSPGLGTSPVPVSASITGLTANTPYHFRISATNAGGTNKGSDDEFKTPENPPAVVTAAASSVTQTTATLNATVNPSGAEVTKCEFEYGTTTAYGKIALCTPSPGAGTSPVVVSASVTGLTANTTYHFRISATNESTKSEGKDETLKTLPNAPTVELKPASSITLTTATLNAMVNPNGGEVTKCEFEYGTTTSYGSKAPCTALPGSGTSLVVVSAPITGLTANTTYHFRLVATNAGGKVEGADETFKTTPLAPVVETGAASSVTQTTATLSANVNPNGSNVTECELEYGTTTSYGSKAACSSSPGSGSSPVGVSAPITGLSASTTYHFRVSASTAGGTSRGNDATFTTAAVPPVPNAGPTNPPATQAALPRPVLGRTANIATVAGRVRIRLPGTPGFVALSSARPIPYGTVVEATHGEVGVAAATPAGGIWIGRFFDGKFVLTQGRDGNVLATLAGGNFSVCSPRKRAGHATRRAAGGHLVRRLWAETGGNFSTKAKYAEGIVHGAQWLTEDLCEGTLILATRERVQVTDLVHGRRAQVATGHVYLVKPH